MRADLLEKEKEISRRWAPHYSQVFSDLYNEQLRSDLVASVLARLPHGRKLVLDIGAGPGCIARSFRRLDPDARVIGLDISSDVLNAAGPAIAADCVVASAEQPPFAPATFDAVVGYHVLHHLENPAGVLTRALALLKPGGCLCFVEPAENDLDHQGWKLRAMRLPIRPLVRSLRRHYRQKVASAHDAEMAERSDVHVALDMDRVAAALRTPEVEVFLATPKGLYSGWVGATMYGERLWERPVFAGLRQLDRAVLGHWPELGAEVQVLATKRRAPGARLGDSRSESLGQLLSCPRCSAGLETRSAPDGFACRKCSLFFANDQGLPSLLVELARELHH